MGDNAAPVKRRNWLKIVLMLSVPLLLVAVAAYYWSISGLTVATDNAYVQQDKLSVSAEISGRITAINVTENQQVKQGDVLFKIDSKPYELAIKEANAAIAQAQSNVIALSSDRQAAEVNIAAAREEIAFAKIRYDRQKALLDRGFSTRRILTPANMRLIWPMKNCARRNRPPYRPKRDWHMAALPPMKTLIFTRQRSSANRHNWTCRALKFAHQLPGALPRQSGSCRGKCWSVACPRSPSLPIKKAG